MKHEKESDKVAHIVREGVMVREWRQDEFSGFGDGM